MEQMDTVRRDAEFFGRSSGGRATAGHFLDSEEIWWELSHMSTIVKADDKGRILIRGTERGRQYLVTAQDGGWWVVPAPKVRPPKKRRQWSGSKMSLAHHLQALADSGLRIDQADNTKAPVGPCRF
jgi:hypothetical protein